MKKLNTGSNKAVAGGLSGLVSLPISNIISYFFTQFVPPDIIGSVEDIVFYVVAAGLPVAAVYFTPNKPQIEDPPTEPITPV